MQPFIKEYPALAPYIDMKSEFEWKWYYAFQQMGDLKAAKLSKAYRDAAAKKYELAGFVSWISPPSLLQRSLTRAANTDSIAAYAYEQQIRDYHQQLREFYYPWLFYQGDPTKAALENMPRFENITQSGN
jgi:ABC-2 type transport system permease protein